MKQAKDIFEIIEEERRKGASDIDVYRRAISFIQKRIREDDIPFVGHFEMTPLCNLDCKMCYVHLDESQMEGNKLLSAKTWIDLMQQAINNGMASAILSGGECLTYPQFDEVFLFLKSRGVDVTIMTNGVLLNSERIAFFKKHFPSMIQVSLYGDSEEAYEKLTGKQVFSTVLANIRAAKEADLPVTIAVTPSKYMMESVKGTIRLVKEIDLPLHVNTLLMTPRRNTGRVQMDFGLDIDQYVDLLRLIAEIQNTPLEPCEVVPMERGCEDEFSYSGLKCGAGRSSFAIEWDGSMHPCAQLNSIVSYPVTKGFALAWKQINQEAKSFPSFSKCQKCAYSQVCNFCAAENEKLGARDILDPVWCEQTWRKAEIGLVQVADHCKQV